MKQFLVDLKLLIEEPFVLLLLFVQLADELLVVLDGRLFLGDEFLDFNVLVAVQLCLEAFGGDLFFGCQFLTKLFVLDLGNLLRLNQLLLFVVKVLSDIFKLFDLDLKDIKLDACVFNCVSKVGFF